MSQEKTEEPTQKKLRDARKEGQVANSKEVTSAALMLTFFAIFMVTLPDTITRLQALIRLPARFLQEDVAEATDQLLAAMLAEGAAILAPYLAVAVLVSIAAGMGQFGLLLGLKAVMPSLKKLNPAEYFKKTFGMQNLMEFGKSVLKIILLSLLLFFVIRDGLHAMVLAPTCGIACLRAVTAELLTTIVYWCVGPFIIIAAADYAFTKSQFIKQQKMSKDEVKREYKESEGDPMIKGMRRQLHQEMLAEGAVDRSRKASVVVTNPTHVAVAVYYEREKTPLPVITAMGTDILAKRMMAAAEAAGVPVMRNVALARGLLEQGDVDQYIPSDLIEPFAEVLRALQDLAQQGGAR